MNDQTPSSLGYFMPAQWSPHKATWLAWPHNRETWPGLFEEMPKVWARLVAALAPFESVHILAGGKETNREAAAMVGHLSGVTIHNISTDDAWIRDFGPLFLSRWNSRSGGSPALVDWQYNAWGEKYPPYDKDQGATRKIAEAMNFRRFAPPIVLEGGAIDVNGRGAALAGESCLLGASRNPNLARLEMEKNLKDYLGISHVIWLCGEITGDDTDGHVDQLARFVAEDTVVVAVEENRGDPNFESLRNIRRVLESSTDQEGRPLRVIPLPMPGPIFNGSQRLPASYCNFYIANHLVIVPQFDDPADGIACEVLGVLFPDRQLYPLAARAVVTGLGAFHCVTQQQPLPMA